MLQGVANLTLRKHKAYEALQLGCILFPKLQDEKGTDLLRKMRFLSYSFKVWHSWECLLGKRFGESFNDQSSCNSRKVFLKTIGLWLGFLFPCFFSCFQSLQRSFVDHKTQVLFVKHPEEVRQVRPFLSNPCFSNKKSQKTWVVEFRRNCGKSEAARRSKSSVFRWTLRKRRWEWLPGAIPKPRRSRHPIFCEHLRDKRLGEENRSWSFLIWDHFFS